MHVSHIFCNTNTTMHSKTWIYRSKLQCDNWKTMPWSRSLKFKLCLCAENVYWCHHSSREYFEERKSWLLVYALWYPQFQLSSYLRQWIPSLSISLSKVLRNNHKHTSLRCSIRIRYWSELEDEFRQWLGMVVVWVHKLFPAGTCWTTTHAVIVLARTSAF